MKILLATHNPAKIKDYRLILAEQSIEIETLNSLNIKDKFEETKSTFKENAEDKALFYYNLAQISTIAEDSGFEIDFFNGEPGVKSRRWLGHESTDEEIVEFLEKKIKEIPEDKRTARFKAVLCLVKTESEIYCAENSVEGYLTEEYNENYNEGFPYRAFFIEKTFNKYLMELSEEEYKQVNHRRKNVDEIVKKF